ncbi:hypothetical protein F5884DRAFT_799002 [Xylogone sp. PMI_703]|nr:hypothetical protein F5884DRAFT_799002 [Xylogone sp. PMI_703]
MITSPWGIGLLARLLSLQYTQLLTIHFVARIICLVVPPLPPNFGSELMYHYAYYFVHEYTRSRATALPRGSQEILVNSGRFT